MSPRKCMYFPTPYSAPFSPLYLPIFFYLFLLNHLKFIVVSAILLFACRTPGELLSNLIQDSFISLKVKHHYWFLIGVEVYMAVTASYKNMKCLTKLLNVIKLSSIRMGNLIKHFPAMLQVICQIYHKNYSLKYINPTEIMNFKK